MLEKLISQSLKHRPIAIVGLLLIIVFGVHALSTLPIDAFPDVTSIQIEIISTAAGLAPLEIENQVTTPIENTMRGLPGLDEMRSVTKFGIAVVTLVFTDQTDLQIARQMVFQRLAEAEKGMPEGVNTAMGPIATAMGEIYHYTLAGHEPAADQEKINYLTELRTIQDWIVTPLLKNINGVSEINSFGGYIKQYQVIADPQLLLKYGLCIADVVAALKANNRNVGGSTIDRHDEQYIVRGIGLVTTIDDINRIVLKTDKGAPINIGNVAQVEIGQALRQGAALKNGNHEVVGGIVMMLRGENSREVVQRVQEKVAEINESNVLPAGMRIVPYYERSQIIESSLATVSEALLLGMALVLIVLFLFLRNVRGALIVILSLPLSLLLTFTVMKRCGVDANLMTLGGLAISIGMIIDATIIQVENVQRRLSEALPGSDRLAIVRAAVLEVRKPSIFGEFIIALTFLPILSLQGMEGKMFTPLAFTVTIALLASLLLSIFFIPVLCSYFLSVGQEREGLLMRGARKIYLPMLHAALRHRVIVMLLVGAFLVLTVLLIPKLGSEFLPIMDEGAFDMDIQVMPGIALAKAVDINRQVEEKLLQFPELQTIIGRTGQSGIALEAKGPDKTGYTGMFKPRSQWRPGVSKESLLLSMREALDTIPGMVYSFSQPIQCRIDELVAGTKAQLIIKLFGDNSQTLKSKANEISNVLTAIPGTADLVVEQTMGQPYISIRVKRDQIARYGISVEDVLSVIEIAVGGKTATQVYEGRRFFDCVVRFPAEKRQSESAIAAILIENKQGQRIPLAQLAEIVSEEGPVQISHENGQRLIGIELNITGRDIGRYVQDAKAALQKKVPLPVGYYLSWGGQFENQQRAMSRLLVIAPVVVLLILVLLFITFDSLRLGLLVIINLPFALIGGVFALYISGLYLSVPASLGFIVLFGVAVLNGVVLVSCIAELRRDGKPLAEAIATACRIRLRPVLMTASIAIFSLIPMLFASGPGSEVQKPLAVVVVGGLLTSTFLTLIVLPVLYGFFDATKKPD